MVSFERGNIFPLRQPEKFHSPFLSSHRFFRWYNMDKQKKKKKMS